MIKSFIQTQKIIHSLVVKSIGVAFVTTLLFISMLMNGTPLVHATVTHVAAAPSSNCAVTKVQLHGNNPPTITCLQKQNTGKIQPNIRTTPCTSYDVQFGMTYSGVSLCVTGVGYLSSGQFGVGGFYNVHSTFHFCSAGWIRAYNPGGSFPSWNDWTGQSNLSQTYQDVTQIDITATYC